MTALLLMASLFVGSETSYDNTGNAESMKVVDENGNTIDTTLDDRGNATRIDYGNSDTITMTYDAAGLLRSVVDGRHPKDTATDDNGRTTALKSGPFNLATISYDDAGRPTSESNPELGTTTTYQYNDPLGRLTNKIITMPTAGGNSVQTESHSYQGVQDTITRTTTTTTAGHSATRTENIELTRDAAGRITRSKETTSGGEHIITMTYNAYGQVLTSNDQATGLTTTNRYDALGNLTGSDASRMRITQTVDVDGTLRKRTTTGPHTALTVTEDFDVWGRPTKTTTTAFGGSTTTISYSEGTRTITPPVGAVITETFNGRGLVSKRDRGEVKSTIRYDGTRMEKVSSTQPHLNSSMESIVDAVGRTESTYEDTGHAIYSTTTSWNNRTGTENASWRSAQATLIIDGYGRDVQQTIIGVVSQSIVDVDGGTVLRKSPNLHPQKYTYDNNQVATIDWGGRTTTMDYDAAGRMIEQVDPLFHSITNSYDELNIIRSSVISAEVEETHAFDTGGYLSNRDTANGTHSYSHGPGGELLSLVTPTGAYGYTYEKDGLLNSLQPPGGALQRFTYDSNRRLASRSRGTSKWITTHRKSLTQNKALQWCSGHHPKSTGIDDDNHHRCPRPPRF